MKCNYLEILLWLIIFIILNSLLIFFIVIYCWIDKNALWIIFADKFILLDIATFLALGKKNGWKIFKYWIKLKANTNGKKEISKKGN